VDPFLLSSTGHYITAFPDRPNGCGNLGAPAQLAYCPFVKVTIWIQHGKGYSPYPLIRYGDSREGHDMNKLINPTFFQFTDTGISQAGCGSQATNCVEPMDLCMNVVARRTLILIGYDRRPDGSVAFGLSLLLIFAPVHLIICSVAVWNIRPPWCREVRQRGGTNSWTCHSPGKSGQAFQRCSRQ